MQASLYNQKAESIGTIELSDSVFGLPMNNDLLYQVINALMSNKRQVIAHTKGRSEVRGGGKKPWKQKGTGRARHGSIRSPIWKGGGVTHGPSKDRNFKKKINQKVAQKALGIALSTKVRENHLVILDGLQLTNAKTREADAVLKQMASILPGYIGAKKRGTVLIVVPNSAGNLRRSFQNIPNTDVQEARNLNALLVLSSKFILMPKDSVETIEKRFKSTRQEKAGLRQGEAGK